MINPANIGYLPGVVYKELSAGRKCEVTGSMMAFFENMGDYKNRKNRLIGKFGEVVSRTPSGVALIATRVPPPWAEKKIDEVIWDCDEMLRWDVPEEER